MFDSTDLILAFIAGFFAAVGIVAWLLKLWIARLHDLLEKVLSPESGSSNSDSTVNGKIIPLKIEVDNNQFLCYNMLTQQFVCQGSNVQEIIERFQQRFPGFNATLDSGDEQALSTLRQQLQEHRNASVDTQ